MNRVKLATAVAALAVAGTLLMAPLNAAADARSDCQHRIERAHQHYQEAARAHGRESRQAQDARARLTNEWDRCYNEVHAWYDPNRHEWRNDRDWDRNFDWDHDHDRDHDNH
jgi:hypothetical protein